MIHLHPSTNRIRAAGRRLRSLTGAAASPRVSPEPPAPPAPVPLVDVEVSVVGHDVRGFFAQLSGGTARSTTPVTPLGLAAAVAHAIDRAGGQGSPIVTRSPAVLHSPEYWHVRLEGADPAARTTLERAFATRRTR